MKILSERGKKMKVSEKVRKLRGELSLRKFAKLIGVSPSAISRVETSKRMPGLMLAKGLSKYSKKDLEYWVK
jgi:transcriptional regulator with XRE-family HTH domain